MTNYIIKRLFHALFVLFGVATIVFFLVRLTGDPIMLMLPPDTPMEQVEEMRHHLGYDRPLLEQYLKYILKLLRFDLGESLRYNESTFGLIIERIPNTIKLSAIAMILSIIIAIPSGVTSALKRGGFIDQSLMSLSLVGQAVPVFWAGILLILLFSVNMRILPTGGIGTLKHFILPSIALALRPMALISRLLRSSIVEALDADYVRTAYSKGLTKIVVIGKHAFRNSILPVVTVIGLEFGYMLGGAVVTETLFAWPGIGLLLSQAITYRDFPLAQAIIIFLSVAFVFINLLTDIFYAFIDPRIRYD